MCVLAPKVVCCGSLQNCGTAPLLIPACSSCCSWRAVRCPVGPWHMLNQIWENNAANHFWMLYLVLLPEGDLFVCQLPWDPPLILCLSKIINVHDSVLGLFLWVAICGLMPSRWNLHVCQWEVGQQNIPVFTSKYKGVQGLVWCNLNQLW